MLNYPRIAAEIARHQWAITEEALDGIRLAVESVLRAEDRGRFHAGSEDDYAILFSQLGELYGGARYMRKRGNLGSLFIGGPIVPRASEMLESSGMVSLDRLTSELKELEGDESISSILLVFDSPGGVVTGVAEFEAALAACDKPTIAYAFGAMASAAYWIGSAADKIYASPTSLVGSVGVLREVSKSGDSLIIRNSQSPKKGLDPSSDEGRKDGERILTGLADVFISTVAKNRNVSKDTVTKDFGQGSVLVATEALAAGAIDKIVTLSDTIIGLQSSGDSDMSTVALEPQEEMTKMPTLHELVAANPGLSSEISAIKEAAREEGAAAERALAKEKEAKDKERGHLLAVEILESSEYAALHSMALKALKGDLSEAALAGAKGAFEALAGAQSTIDLLKAKKEEELAVEDSAESPAIAVADPFATPKSGDGLASIDDIASEIKEFRGE